MSSEAGGQSDKEWKELTTNTIMLQYSYYSRIIASSHTKLLTILAILGINKL